MRHFLLFVVAVYPSEVGGAAAEEGLSAPSGCVLTDAVQTQRDTIYSINEVA